MSEFDPLAIDELEFDEALPVTPKRLVEPKKCPPGYGWRWIKEAFFLFRKTPFMWLGFLFLYLLGSMILAQLPGLALALYVIGPVFMGAIIRGCAVLDQKGDLEFPLLCAGLWGNTGRLILLGLSFVVVTLLGALVFGIPAYFLGVEDPRLLRLIVLLVASLAIAPVWFAPALVVLHDKSWLEAMRGSIRATFRNIQPLFVLSIIGFLLLLPVMFLAAVLVVGLTLLAVTTDFVSGYLSDAIGLLLQGRGGIDVGQLLLDPQVILATLTLAVPTLIWIQLILLSQYSAYRDIFLETELD